LSRSTFSPFLEEVTIDFVHMTLKFLGVIPFK
jgi:hypothetical protein